MFAPRFLTIWLLNLASSTIIQEQRPILEDDGQKPILDKPTTTLPALLNALDVLQAEHFEVWQGIWPEAIDWTAAVIGTYLSSAIITISSSYSHLPTQKTADNIINKYFSNLVGAYFGQDAFALRQEAYDDMLWVVLGWLETTKFVSGHSELHYGSEHVSAGPWYGEQWVPAFSHRARIFWDMASQGWDTSLCDGGMIWNPNLVPYKNAITNELYITASISMYLYFPGDPNTSPFGLEGPSYVDDDGRAHHPKYLAAAIEGYKWLTDSNMTDAKGLYVDGYHISGWSREKPKNDSHQNTKCDARNEMVYTYNQGVLLSGQRGLYLATGARSYLEDGHKLVSDVIAATGWDLKHDRVLDNDSEPDTPRKKFPKWHGLGRAGIMEEFCDAEGYCSQDSQTFKGIFFHHLTLFCERLPDHLVLPGELFLSKGAESPASPPEVRKWHDEGCERYGGWIKHNAKAALSTLDQRGKFGMWWGAPRRGTGEVDGEVELPGEAVDYRNLGVPREWRSGRKGRRDARNDEAHAGDDDDNEGKIKVRDLNDRGRGRTVETQGGGISVLRAMWELVDTRQ